MNRKRRARISRSCGMYLVLFAVLILVSGSSSSASAQRRPTWDTPSGRAALIDSIAALVEHHFVIPDRAKEFADSLVARREAGRYETPMDSVALAERITSDLWEITGDRHFRLRVIDVGETGESARSALRHPLRYYRLGQDEHLGFARLQWMEGNVGYLGLRRFYPLSVSKEMVDAAMTFLAGADAVIIDLRENGGGAGESLPYFTRYFLPYPMQLTSYYSRETDFLTEYWVEKDVAGPRLPAVPVFLLTGENTFSAAEIFAYDMQVRGRATLVGAATGGGARSVDLFPVGERFEIYIPTARAINPVTNGNWEGTGVLPDVSVPAASALDTALVLARAAGRGYREPLEAEVAEKVLEMEGDLARAEAAFRDHRLEEGEEALRAFFETGARQGLISEFFLEVLTYNYTGEGDEDLLLQLLRRRVDLFPRSVAAHESLATVLAGRGEVEAAREHLLRALELNPDNRNVTKRLEALKGQGGGTRGRHHSGRCPS